MSHKILFVSNTAIFIRFNRPLVEWCKAQGWKTGYASMAEKEIDCCDKVYKIDIHRSPFSPSNLKGIEQVRNIIDEGGYDIVHCHTPMGAVVARLAARKARKQRGVKVIYTAHGFHFFNGAPLKFWLLFYPVEWILSFITDALVTINNEDYTRAKEHLHAKKTYMIDGVGIDLDRYHCVGAEEKASYRQELGLKEDEFVMLYVAEFIPRKNHKLLLDIAAQVMKGGVESLKVILCGDGEIMEQTKHYAQEIGIAQRVMFLNYRNDIDKICQASDVYVATSHQEGLPLGVLEAMATGLPVVATNVRGQRDLVKDGKDGYIFDDGCKDLDRKMAAKVVELYQNPELRAAIGQEAAARAKKYSLTKTVPQMTNIYLETLKETK